jgi:transcription initiation factor IIE alpha subunit
MSTTMARALRKAGGGVPVNRRIWDWLKEKGPHTGSEVSSALNIPLAASSSIISQMKARGMVRVETKHSEHLGRNVGYYAASGRVFEILPLQKNKERDKVEAVENLASNSIQMPKQTSDQILESLPVSQAFELYKKLDSMFSQKA